MDVSLIQSLQYEWVCPKLDLMCPKHDWIGPKYDSIYPKFDWICSLYGQIYPKCDWSFQNVTGFVLNMAGYDDVDNHLNPSYKHLLTRKIK